MSYLIDTNVLLRIAQPTHSMYQTATDAVAALRSRGEEIVLVAQILYEFWVVATRPLADNGLGLTVAETTAEIQKIRGLFQVHPDSAAILPQWEMLVTTLGVMGKNSHDARLVAAMQVHHITHLLTFNDKDFARFAGIIVQTPALILMAPTS